MWYHYSVTDHTTFIDQIVCSAERFLAPLGNRWLHVQGVARKAKLLRPLFDGDDGTFLVAAAYLHDIGYAPDLQQTGFHPLDGTYYVRYLGYDRLAALVAHHSEARFEAHLRHLGPQLAEFPRECSAVADALIYCDLTTSPTGTDVSLKDRKAEVFIRYGETSIVSQALRQASPSLSLAIARTQRRIYRYGMK